MPKRAWKCPACGSRNRAKREFCARCGEAFPEGAAAPAAARPAGAAAADTAGGLALPSAPTLAVLGLLALGAWGVDSLRPSPGEAPTPAMFAAATLPARLPRSSSAPLSGAEVELRAAEALLARGEGPEAVARLAPAVGRSPGDARLRHAYARALWATSAREAALDEYRRAAALAPRDAPRQADLARALDNLGRHEEAAAEFERALELRPADAELLQQAAGTLIRAKQPERAVHLLRRAARLRPDDALVAHQLGEAYEKAGDLPAAAAAYQETLRRFPVAAITRGRLAEVRFAQRRVDEAVEVFKAGLARDARSPLLHRGLGSLLERAGRGMEAAAEYREYARLAPNARDARELARRADALDGARGTP